MRHLVLGLGMAALLAGCGDPLRNVARLGSVDVADGAASIAQSPSETRDAGGGLLRRLLNRQPDDPTNAAVEAALVDAGVAMDDTPVASEDLIPAAVVSEPAPEGARGLFGLFRRNADSPAVPEPDVAAVIEQPTPAPVLAAATPRRGLAALFGRAPSDTLPRTGPDTSDVTAGAVMPFGEIARVCGLRNNQLGKQIENASGYRIYDTIPGSNAPRPFYITGFGDNCARTFTGAVVVTGDAETHEFVRYRPSNERIDYTETDNAYEALKASVCRVGRGQPCGERLSQMQRNTQFITVYNLFGGTFSAVPTQWAQILVHDGEVIAMSIKNGS